MTTTPQSNTAYVGLVNTTSSTAPTGYASYTWSLFKGPKGDTGNQGIQGPKGADGQTTYTWVKYADTETGSGMSDNPAGKRYIGLAFNKTTQTESSTASQYTWSPLYDNVQVGGRNLIRNSDFSQGSKHWTTGSYIQFLPPEDDEPGLGIYAIDHTATTATNTPLYNTRTFYLRPKAGDSITFSFEFFCENVATSGPTGTIFTFRSWDAEIGGTYVLSLFSGSISQASVVNGKWNRLSFTYTFTESTAVEGWYRFGPYLSNTTGRTVKYKYRGFKAELGNVASQWSLAPEDFDELMNGKASNEDISNLAEIISDMSAEVNLKAGMGEIQAMEEAFNARVEQDIEDKAQLAQKLSDLEGRTELVEILAGDNKLVTQFIDTYISESEEGIFVGNRGNNTGILVGTDRISFLDNGTEVAYISNQTMEITHGIFVESATISNFKFERIPGTTILGITWVGD